MEKDFEAWHRLKATIQDIPTTSLKGYKERDVWWTCLGHNVGDEEDGKHERFDRPVLVIKGFSKHLFWGVPLSTINKRGIYYYPFELHSVTSVALLSQLRVFDTRRFLRKLGMAKQRDFEAVKTKLKEFLA